MTSERKLKANRANARASTGPKTIEGKARASVNARRHGLSVSILKDPILKASVENVAREIAGAGPDLETSARARCIAEAQTTLNHVRCVRQLILTDLLSDENTTPAAQRKLTRKLSKITKQLVAIDRYERRALSRRKFAIRELDSLRRQSG